MSIYRLRRRVKALSRATLGLGVVVVLLGILVMVTMDKPHVSGPTPEPVSDALAVATISNYAKLEAGRMVKMAAVLMDMGGEYTARCDAVYNTVTDKTEVEYSVTWRREDSEKQQVKGDKIVVTPERETIERVWSGANWAECMAKMQAWKRGE